VNCAKKNRTPFDLIEDISRFLKKNEIDICALTEVDFKSTKEADNFKIENYITLTPPSESEYKVRVVIIVKNQFEKHLKQRKDLGDTNTVWLELNLPKSQKYLLAATYREWGAGAQKKICEQIERISELSYQLQIASNSKHKTWIAGDWNLDGAKYDDENWYLKNVATKLTETMSESGFRRIRVGPTYEYRIDNEIRTSELDYFFTNALESSSPIKTSIITCGFSDHDAAQVELPIDNGQIMKRSWKDSIIKSGGIKNERKYKEDVKRTVNQFMKQSAALTCNEKAKNLTEMISEIIKKHAPSRKISIGKPKRPSISNETKKLMVERDAAKRLVKQMTRDERHIQLSKYKKLRNRVVASIRNDQKRNAESSLKCGVNPWHIANKFLGKSKSTDMPLIENGKTITDDKEKAETMNEFFIEKVELLRGQINPKQIENPLQKLKQACQWKNRNFQFKKVTKKEVERIISKMKKSSSSGVDGISSMHVKIVKKELAPALTILINSSLTEGVFPDCFKLAKIVCIFKNKGERSDKKNYRPVSNLAFFGKCIEVVVDVQLRSYCEKYNLFGSHQHGFRRSRSTTTTLLTALTRWRSNKNDKKFQGALLFDLSAAYDLLDKDLFLHKARLYGITGTALNWLDSYLSDRRQVVQVGNVTSTSRNLKFGTPQGSSCSCLIFALFVGDIGQWIGKSFIQAFADDTFISVEADSMEELREKMQSEGEKVVRYFYSNHMVVNPSKTEMLIFRPHQHNITDEQITLGNEIIKESDKAKLLGLWITRDLKWKMQIKSLTSELNYSISVLWRLRKILGNRELKMIADGLVMAKIRYCLPVFGVEFLRLEESQALSSQLQDLQKVQNDTLRIILGHKRKDHIRISDMLKATKLLSVNQTIAYSSLMEMWKAKEFSVPVLESLLVRKRNETKILRSDSSGKVQSSINETFANTMAKLWNSSSDRFKHTNLLVIAKHEAKKLASTLPV